MNLLGARGIGISPKAYLIDHMTTYQAQECGSPSYSWCYGDEVLVGYCIDIANVLPPEDLQCDSTLQVGGAGFRSGR